LLRHREVVRKSERQLASGARRGGIVRVEEIFCGSTVVRVNGRSFRRNGRTSEVRSCQRDSGKSVIVEEAGLHGSPGKMI
jgi:hypothetical protein